LHGKLTTAAERKAGDRGDDRFAGFGDAMPRSDEIAEEGVGEGLTGHFFDVGAGSKSFVGAGDDDAADIFVDLERVDGLSTPPPMSPFTSSSNDA